MPTFWTQGKIPKHELRIDHCYYMEVQKGLTKSLKIFGIRPGRKFSLSNYVFRIFLSHFRSLFFSFVYYYYFYVCFDLSLGYPVSYRCNLVFSVLNFLCGLHPHKIISSDLAIRRVNVIGRCSGYKGIGIPLAWLLNTQF